MAVPAAPRHNSADRPVGIRATILAGQSARLAVRWLQRQHVVQRARLGPDGATIDIEFRDGGRLVILPRAMRPLPSLNHLHDRIRLRSGAAIGRAAVLEPFSFQLGAAAGQTEIDGLTLAGFKVDVTRDRAVTVQSMESLANYSVVYMETHAGVLPGGDAVVATGETNAAPYAALFRDQSLLQITAAGDPTGRLYNAITSTFVNRHLSIFPPSSILYLDGCSLLSAPLFWRALQGRNVDTLLSWDREVLSDASEQSATFMLTNLMTGESIASGLAATRAAGLGIGSVGGIPAHLGFAGDGEDTLARALAGTVPTPTPTMVPTVTSTPTVTDTPTVTPTRAAARARKCKPGHHRVKGRCRRNRPHPPTPTPTG